MKQLQQTVKDTEEDLWKKFEEEIEPKWNQMEEVQKQIDKKIQKIINKLDDLSNNTPQNTPTIYNKFDFSDFLK